MVSDRAETRIRFLRCQCPKCKPFMKDNRTISDFYWGFVFDLAERLEEVK